MRLCIQSPRHLPLCFHPSPPSFLASSQTLSADLSDSLAPMLSLAALTPLAYHLAGPKPTQGRANAVKMAAAVDASAC